MTNKINISSFYESDEDIQNIINVCNKYFYIDDCINKKQLEYVIKNNEVYHYFDYNNHDRKIIEELLHNMKHAQSDSLGVSEYKTNVSHSLIKDLTKNILNNNQEIIIKHGNSQDYS
jgi:hypothetical protein